MKLVFDVLPVDPTLSRREPEQRVPYPAPEVSSRDGVMMPAPGAVTALADYGHANGWSVHVQYARGCFPHAITGKPGAPKDTWAVTFRRPGFQAYAVRDASTWLDVCMRTGSIPPFTLAGVTDLKEWLVTPWVGVEWYDAIRARVAQQEAFRARREACAKGVHDDARVTGVANEWRRCWTCENHWYFQDEPWRKMKKGRGEAL